MTAFRTVEAAAVALTAEQRAFLTLRTHKAVSISGKGWDGLVAAGLIEDNMAQLRLTPAGLAVSYVLGRSNHAL